MYFSLLVQIHAELKENITKTIINIPKEKYRNIIRVLTKDQKNIYPRKTIHEQSRRLIYEFLYKKCEFTRMERKGVNLQGCKQITLVPL